MKTWQRLLGAGTVLWAVAECTPSIHNPNTNNPDLSVATKTDMGTTGSTDFAVTIPPDMYMTPLALTAINPPLGPSTGSVSLTLTGTAFRQRGDGYDWRPAGDRD